jgi:hypothetical protein
MLSTALTLLLSGVFSRCGSAQAAAASPGRSRRRRSKEGTLGAAEATCGRNR